MKIVGLMQAESSNVRILDLLKVDADGPAFVQFGNSFKGYVAKSCEYVLMKQPEIAKLVAEPNLLRLRTKLV